MKPLRMTRTLIVLLACVSTAIAVEPIPLPEGAKLADMHNGYDYEPFEVKDARLIPRVEFLQPGRDWERLDVYIPESAQPGDKLPCIVNVYGGGYGQKVVGTIRTPTQGLVDAGYVVVCPDYALGVHAPETIASWDVANALRHVRANAEKYNVDPERIGLCGWSAGGWLSQFVGYANPRSLRPVRYTEPPRTRDSGPQPTVQPRPLYAGHPRTVQAVVSDWGAGKLRNGGKHGEPATPHEMVTPDDPPLMSCFNGKPREMPNSTLAILKSVGVPAEGAFLGDAKSMHVPAFDTPGWNAAGGEMTWIESICDFFDRHVKAPTQSSAPEIMVIPTTPATMNTTVRLLSVHSVYGDGSVHYTLDGAEPTTDSPRYDKPIELKPGQTVKAIAIEPGLSASRIAGYTAPKLPRPVITNQQAALEAKVGEPFRVQFAADLPEGATLQPEWILSGMIGRKYDKKTIPWMRIDRKTGELTGVPRQPGAYAVVVGCYVSTDNHGRHEPDQTVADARLIVITVQPRR